MEIILTSRKLNVTIQTGYDKNKKIFRTVYTMNDKESIVEEFEDINQMVAVHGFWCKITGIIKTPYTKKEFYAHTKPILEIINRGGICA